MTRLMVCAATLLIGLAALPADAQSSFSQIVQDFENDIPVPGQPPSIAFAFGGVSGGVDPFNPVFPQEVTAADPVAGTSQAYRVSFDTSGVVPQQGQDFRFYFGGWSIFAGFFGDASRTGGAPGATDPSNWVVSVDVRSEGAIGAEALRGEFVYFDPDFDTVFGFDGNANGSIGGAETYALPFVLSDDPTDGGFTTNRINLGVGAATTEVDGDIPRFNDDGNWVLNFNFSHVDYGFDAGNAITIDNITIEFIPEPASAVMVGVGALLVAGGRRRL